MQSNEQSNKTGMTQAGWIQSPTNECAWRIVGTDFIFAQLPGLGSVALSNSRHSMLC